MRTSFVLVIFIFLCSCSDTRKVKVPQGNASKIEYFIPKMILVSSGQMSQYKTIRIDGCNFDLVMSNNDTTYLATSDRKFQTPEGYKVGTKFSELPRDIQTDLTKESGWGYYYKLSTGWALGFCEGNSCTDKYPEKKSEVKWIFKRR